MKKSKETLADKIAGVLNTTPASFDPEDDNEDTRAKVVEDFSEEQGDEVELLSTFRKQNVQFLDEVDKRYAGREASRNIFDDGFSENGYSSEPESIGSFDSEKFETGNASNSSEELSEEEEEESEESDEGDETLYDESETKKDTKFKHFTDIDASSQIKKGLCVRNQMNMWENLLEIRIQLQKCLIAANKMPQKNNYMEMKKETGQEFTSQVATTKQSLTNLLNKLLLLQNLSLSKYPETKKLNKDIGNSTKDGDDEEIPSDTGDEISAAEEEEPIERPRKRRKMIDFEKDISEKHNLYKNYRDSVIQKWNDKTRVATLKNNSSSHSVLNHIEHTLSDKTKLIKKTQLKRSDYTILGQDSCADDNNEDSANKSNKPVEEYSTEIFDDNDFYHQLLRELIEVKSADVTDPIQLGRQWIQLQKLRSKMKRKIDTKATKGRKIRYTVHTKLVNFMAPIDEQSWTEQSKTELFSSLFGKKEYSGS